MRDIFRLILAIIALIAVITISGRAEDNVIAVIYQDEGIHNAITIDEPCPITLSETQEGISVASEPSENTEAPQKDKSQRKYLGTYYVTRYCSCEKCCGKYAKNRPNGIVYGASGKALTYNHSCASPLPFDTVLEIEGIEGQYVVEDRTDKKVAKKTNNRIIDIYTASHDEAKQWGCKKLDVYEVISKDRKQID